MIHNIPVELFTIIKKNLSYKDFQNLNEVMVIGISNKEIFLDDKIFGNSYLQKALQYRNISADYFLEILENSALDINNIYEILLAITTNSISNKNKYDYNLIINQNKQEESEIQNTTTILKILMMSFEHHVSEEFIINNPYYYTYVNISNTLIGYFQNIISRSYHLEKEIESNSFKFNLLIFEYPWYRSSINIYYIFLLYLLNIDVISPYHADRICEICEKHPALSHHTENDTFATNIIQLFLDKTIINNTLSLCV